MTALKLPSSWSKQDVNTFLKWFNRKAEGIGTITVASAERPEQHCYESKPCRFWVVPNGRKAYQGDCGLGSCTCLTAIFNREKPTRWMAREE